MLNIFCENISFLEYEYYWNVYKSYVMRKILFSISIDISVIFDKLIRYWIRKRIRLCFNFIVD